MTQDTINEIRRNKLVLLTVATVIMIACIAVLCLLPDLPAEARGFVTAVGSLMAGCVKEAFSYEYGSSRGSAAKNELLTSMAPAVATVSSAAAALSDVRRN